METSYNHGPLVSGLVYPTFYWGLFADLRNALADAAREARADGSFRRSVLAETTARRLGDENGRLASSDHLTGLANRRGFSGKLAARVDAGVNDGRPFGVCVLDFDRFMPVNYTYGHVVGDLLLAAVADRLKSLGGPGVFLSRLGGDEFGCLVPWGRHGVSTAAAGMVAAFERPFEVGGLRVSLGCSYGVAMFPDAGRTAESLFARADYALYESKACRTGDVMIHSEAHAASVRARNAMESALQSADLEAELDVELQPVIDGATGLPTGVEALARWTSPSLGRVSPDVFVPLAERAGHMGALTAVLIRKALALTARLPDEIELSFNLSAHDVASSRTALDIVAAVLASSVRPSRIVFELTETAAMRDLDGAADCVRLLRSLGTRIALDDFGTRHSSLCHLHRLPIDRVKIDRSFAREIGNPSGRALLASVRALCRELGKDCVLEGVETEEQARAAREIGFIHLQGYLYARPMPGPVALDWISQRVSGPPASRACRLNIAPKP